MSDQLIFETLTFKNFLSYGNQPTVVDLSSSKFSVVLGENWDTGGEDSRNGVGKSAMVDAICYVLFGKTIRGISNPKLVNKLARKGQSMLVTLEFAKGEWAYLVERGEKPAVLKLFRKPIDSEEDFKAKDGKTFKFDRTRGKNETTDDIIEVLGFDLTLFEYLIGNSSETIPFMKLPEDRKRDIIERLFGFDVLSKRAKALKDERRDTNKQLTAAESSVEATRQANDRIQSQIASLEAKRDEWDKSKKRDVEELRELVEHLASVDVAEEIETLKLIQELAQAMQDAKSQKREAAQELKDAERGLKEINREMDQIGEKSDKLTAELESLDKSECPTCKQHWEPDPEYREDIEKQLEGLSDQFRANEALIEQAEAEIAAAKERVDEIDAELKELQEAEQEVSEIELTYESLEDASAADATLTQYRKQLEKREAETNPHVESIQGLRDQALKHVDDSEVKELRRLVEHYNLLIDLLLNKDSFLRKSIIDRWLPKLNQRIAFYLDLLELPHQVKFLPDMSMQILNFNEEFDWGNLSKGQRQRVTVALNRAFQDVFEFMNYQINALFVDELIDNGICNRGAANVVGLLKQMCSEKSKRVILVTHRDDIAAQVEDVMRVILQNNISRIEQGR